MPLSATEDSFSIREHKIPDEVLYISEKVYTKIFMATDEFLPPCTNINTWHAISYCFRHTVMPKYTPCSLAQWLPTYGPWALRRVQIYIRCPDIYRNFTQSLLPPASPWSLLFHPFLLLCHIRSELIYNASQKIMFLCTTMSHLTQPKIELLIIRMGETKLFSLRWCFYTRWGLRLETAYVKK